MRNDRLIQYLLKHKKLIVDHDTGDVYNSFGRKLGEKTDRGYIRTSYTYRGKKRILRLHRVVSICVFGAVGYGIEIDHVWGPKDFNRPDNLEAVTGATNSQRANKRGLCNNENNHSERDGKGKFVKEKEEIEKMDAAPF